MTGETKAIASFDEGFNRRSQTHGRILINQLAILAKVAHMHDLQNVAVVNAAEALMGTLRLFFEERKGFSVYLVGEYFFIEDNRTKYNMEDFNNFEFLSDEFKKRKLGALSFNTAIQTPELVLFINAFLSTNLDSEDVYRDLSRLLREAGVSGLSTEELKPPKEDDEIEKVVDTVKAARQAYVRTVVRIKRLFTGIEEGQPADIRNLKRAVQSVVDSVYKNEPVLMRLSAIRRRENVLPRHYANVCLLSLGVGKRLGLSKFQMSRMGTAALLHDIGRYGLPDDLLDRIETDMGAVRILMGHPRRGVDTMLRLKGLNDVAISAMIVAYEHHRNIDGTGYPEMVEDKKMNLFSRVVRIVDNYDSVTSSGIYGRVPVTPDRAIADMAKQAGRYYDEEILSVFVGMMGVYPVGTLLLLSDGSFAVSLGPGSGPDGYKRPSAAVIDAGGQAVPVDLSGEGHGLEIAGTVDPRQGKVDIYRYLV